MTPQEAHEYMENEIRCVQRSKFCDRDCGKCDLVKEDKPLIEAYGLAVLALEKQIPKDLKLKSNGYYGCCNCGHLISIGSNYCAMCGQATTMNRESIKGVMQNDD